MKYLEPTLMVLCPEDNEYVHMETCKECPYVNNWYHNVWGKKYVNCTFGESE